MFALAVFAALTGGTLNLIVTWLMQQLSRLVAFHIGSAEEDEPGAGGHEAYGNGDADDER